MPLVKHRSLTAHGSPRHLVNVLLRAICLAGTLFLAGEATAVAQTESPSERSGNVDIQVTLGFTDTFRLSRWTPVTVILDNHGSDLTGTLEVEAPDGDEVQGSLFTTTHQRLVDLPAQSRKQFRFTVFLESFSRPLEVRVKTRSGICPRQGSSRASSEMTVPSSLLVVGSSRTSTS